jgi:hypothetical protein
MSKCVSVQNENKILELTIRQKLEDKLVEKKAIKSDTNYSA